MKKYKAEKIGHVIAAKRKELGMTQESLASLLQITPQAISKWENETGFPDLTLIPHIAEALQISPNELFGDDKRTTGKCPEHFQGLPFICANGNVALYSNKTVENEQGSIISFTDGSTADLENETVINKGAGDFNIKSISGFLDASISGSGDIFAEHGEVDSLSLTVSGSGDFEASAVTVHNAKISLSGPSSATIGHIIGKSEEKLSSTSSLNVLKRG